jgi:outer membrane lipoprotein
MFSTSIGLICTKKEGDMRYLFWCLFFLVGALGGCAHVMSESGLALADRSITYAEIKKNPETLAGKNVLIGGVISVVGSSGDVLQLEVTQLELHSNGVPDETSATAGRFLVVSGELLDPALYKPGMFVTVIGEVKGQKVQKLDGADYHYPLVSAKEIRLFRASDPNFGKQVNPYQNKVGDDRYMLRPPNGK